METAEKTFLDELLFKIKEFKNSGLQPEYFNDPKKAEGVIDNLKVTNFDSVVLCINISGHSMTVVKYLQPSLIKVYGDSAV